MYPDLLIRPKASYKLANEPHPLEFLASACMHAACACVHPPTPLKLSTRIKVDLLRQPWHFTPSLLTHLQLAPPLAASEPKERLLFALLLQSRDATSDRSHRKSGGSLCAAPRRSLSHEHLLPSCSVSKLRLLGQREDGRTLRSSRWAAIASKTVRASSRFLHALTTLAWCIPQCRTTVSCCVRCTCPVCYKLTNGCMLTHAVVATQHAWILLASQISSSLLLASQCYKFCICYVFLQRTLMHRSPHFKPVQSSMLPFISPILTG